MSVLMRRSAERGFEDFGWTDNWLTFSFGGYRDPKWNNFGPLRVMIENHIQPHQGFGAHSHRDVEIVTYVSAGTLTHKDSFGHTAGVSAGEIQVISAGSRGMIHSERNVHDEVEHNLQIWFIPEKFDTEFRYSQRGFTAEERQGRFRLYASHDEREGSMPIHSDVRVYAGLFAAGDRVEHELERGRGAWVQVVKGRVTVGGAVLEQGDGAGITDAGSLGFEFHESSEVVLLDVRMSAHLIWR